MATETPVRIVFDCETKEETIIPLTAEEIAEMEAASARAEEQRIAWDAEQAAREAARQSAIAKLSALGLTAEEAAAIVGI